MRLFALPGGGGSRARRDRSASASHRKDCSRTNVLPPYSGSMGQVQSPIRRGRQLARRSLGALVCWVAISAPAPGYSAQSELAGPPPVWSLAEGPREWSFPRDHGSHPEYRTEWWYFTGNLRDSAGHRYGYQLTFFRQGIVPKPPVPQNPWSPRDLYLAHFAVTDADAGVFHYVERTSRAGPGLAGAETNRMNVWVLDWRACGEGAAIRVRARSPEAALDLTLAPRKPVVLHGAGGLSRKGEGRGQASYYASLTDLESRGRLTLRHGKRSVEVAGTSWFDHEFGSNQLAPDQQGWDWVSLHFSDGRDLMVYLLRRSDGTLEPASSGTLTEKDGRSRYLNLGDLRLQSEGRWKSPRTGAVYPSAWRLTVPSAGIDVRVTPWLADQELSTGASTGVVYWEGAVGGAGRSGGKAVRCEGYVEMTGYGGSLGGIF